MKTICAVPIYIVMLLSLSFAQNGPAWVPDAVFYQIFPERFRNGDPSNDPALKSLAGSFPHDTTSAWQISPWGSDWYKLQPWEEQNGKGFYFNAQRRRYGGDLQGIIDKLDYLSDLGVNAIYLNPVFESPSLHKYDAESYIHIDNNFGPDPQGDRRIMASENPAKPATWKWTSADKLFLDFLKQAHRRNMHVIIDGVFNHVGLRFWAFQDVLKNGKRSAYKNWFTIHSWDNPETPEDEFDYAGWVGVRELPELKEDANGLIPPIKAHIFAAVRRWMDPDGDGDPSDGIDGWRLDVAEMVHHNFWKDFRKHVKSINPNAYITAEIFWEDWQNNKLMDPAPWLQGDQFDGVMNYRWSAGVTSFFIDQKTKISASRFRRYLEQLDTAYTAQTRFQLLNLMDSHDTDRLASNIMNPDRFYDKNVSVADDHSYLINKPGGREWRILKLISAFQFAMPGPPMIYYGSECGMWGGDDPDERKPMIWNDIQYKPETTHPFNLSRPVDEVGVKQDLLNYFKKLIAIRKEEAPLRHGQMQWLVNDDERDVLVFKRTNDRQEILVAINNSNRGQTLQLSANAGGTWVDLLSAQKFIGGINNLSVTLGPKSAMWLKKIEMGSNL